MLPRSAIVVRFVFLAFVALLSACSSVPLPKYEKPLARTEFQTVRTTAYTHTEADHIAYGNRTAIGTTLRAAGPPVAPPRALPVNDYRPVAFTPTAPPQVGSAAADWSRWPLGTVFRLTSGGQVYRVDDYGFALSGRNTIDLYMPTRAAMNAWATRTETIQVLQWGSESESLRVLVPREKFRHVRRMVLELQGKWRAAAKMK